MEQEKFKPKKEQNVNTKFSLRIPEDLHEELAEYAQKENISMNNLIISCIRYALKNKE
jgi:predicted HicB family RNase H-like nuclease